MNNLKEIREIYGATQEEIASAIGVNRVTVANWELGKSNPSAINQEKLSLYYGIGPEYFLKEPLNDTVRNMIRGTSDKAQAIVAQSNGRRNKAEEYHDIFENASFNKIMQRYMNAMKMLLATADHADLDELEVALQINKKLSRRLQAFINVRKEEDSKDEPTLFDLLNQLDDE